MFRENLKEQLERQRGRFIGEESAFSSAVLLPLVEVNGKWHLLFEVRSSKMRSQPGDICFPGGRIDATDASPLAAALRETHEELGVNPHTVQVIGALSPYVPTSSLIVYPFVGIVHYDQIIHSYNLDEVEEVITVPVDWLMNYEPYRHQIALDIIPSSDFPYEKIANGEAYQWRARYMEEWFFDYGNYTIWGMTGKILKHFVDILKRGQVQI